MEVRQIFDDVPPAYMSPMWTYLGFAIKYNGQETNVGDAATCPT